jgi:2'-5' RNA ligase
VTLAFLGDVSGARADAVESIGAQCAHDASTFTIALDRQGGAAASGIAWLGTGNVAPELARLHERLCSRLDDEGFALDARRFRPHVTLARGARRAPPRAEIAPIAWTVHTLALVASELMPDGPRYRELAAWRFGAVRS